MIFLPYKFNPFLYLSSLTLKIVLLALFCSVKYSLFLIYFLSFDFCSLYSCQFSGFISFSPVFTFKILLSSNCLKVFTSIFSLFILLYFLTSYAFAYILIILHLSYPNFVSIAITPSTSLNLYCLNFSYLNFSVPQHSFIFSIYFSSLSILSLSFFSSTFFHCLIISNYQKPFFSKRQELFKMNNNFLRLDWQNLYLESYYVSTIRIVVLIKYT